MSAPVASALEGLWRTSSEGSSNRVAMLIHTIFEPKPDPINCSSYPRTKMITCDNCHPFNMRTKRRLANFDADSLHWTVICSFEVSRKKVVRAWVQRRVGEAFKNQLKRQGWDSKGRAIDGTIQRNLSGALKMIITAKMGDVAVKASGEEVERACSTALSRVLRRQTPQSFQQRR